MDIYCHHGTESIPAFRLVDLDVNLWISWGAKNWLWGVEFWGVFFRVAWTYLNQSSQEPHPTDRSRYISGASQTSWFHRIARPLPRRNLGDAFGRSGPLGPASRKRFCQFFSLGLVSFQRYRVERWLFLQTSESYLDQISVSEISMCVFGRGLVRVVDIYVSYFRYVMIRPICCLWFFLCWAQNSIEVWVCQGWKLPIPSGWLDRATSLALAGQKLVRQYQVRMSGMSIR